MGAYKIHFRVGKDERVIETVVFADDSHDLTLRRKLAARGIDSPNQFPASAVHIVSVKGV